MPGARPTWCLPVALALLACPATAATQAPTGTTGPPPPAVALASLTLVTPAAAPGGRVVLRVGAGAGGVRLQVRRGGGRWARLRTIGPAAAPRRVVVRAPLRGSVAAFRLARGARRGTVRTVRLRPVTLAAVGDVNLGDGPGRQIARFGPAWPWASVGPTLSRADLAFANLESAISLRGTPWSKQYTFRGTPAALRAARTVGGLDVVNLANNHSVDFGRAALLDTLRTARGVGLAVVGAGAQEAQAYRPLIVERLGLRVAFVGFSSILPFEFRAGPGTPGTAWAFPDRVRAGIRAARRDADVVVATFHWGIERATTESPAQRTLARLALDAGATAVIGAHPHVLQPVRRPDGRRVVAYSLGNFVFSAASPGTSTTRILRLGLAADGVRSVGATPARIVGGRPVL